MNVKFRQMIERRIAEEVITQALAAGFLISVEDGEEITLKKSRGKAKILEAMFTTDEDRLYFTKPGQKEGDSGWVYFVYGNDGWDVINDYTTNLEEMMKPVNALIDKIENGDFKIVV